MDIGTIYELHKEEIESGLAGFNPVLTAIALTLFLDSNWSGILITFVATILTLPIGAAIREVLKPHKIAFLTSPYVIMTWITLLIPNQLKTLHTQIDIIPEHIEKVSFNNDHTSVHFSISFRWIWTNIFNAQHNRWFVNSNRDFYRF